MVHQFSRSRAETWYQAGLQNRGGSLQYDASCQTLDQCPVPNELQYPLSHGDQMRSLRLEVTSNVDSVTLKYLIESSKDLPSVLQGLDFHAKFERRLTSPHVMISPALRLIQYPLRALCWHVLLLFQ